MKNAIKELIDISRYAGCRVDYTQGGGGNTSVKTDDGKIMLIKASGYRLMDITEDAAFVAVDKNMIRDYYESVNLSEKKDREKESAEVSKNAVIELDGIKTLRPSVEVGFHAILKKYVIHTHSVYANLLACANEGERVAEELFGKKDFGFIFLPYINPGFELTLAMKEGTEKYAGKYGKFPEVIFMKNHGLVVTADDINRVKAINTEVNETIARKFGLKDDFREIKLEKTEKGYKSATPVVKRFLEDNVIDKDLLDATPLYPDQLVYLNNILAHSPETLTAAGGEVYYNTDVKQATTLEETLAAYIFVVTNVEKANMTLSRMSKKEVDFINNWEAEKYRRSVK